MAVSTGKINAIHKLYRFLGILYNKNPLRNDHLIQMLFSNRPCIFRLTCQNIGLVCISCWNYFLLKYIKYVWSISFDKKCSNKAFFINIYLITTVPISRSQGTCIVNGTSSAVTPVRAAMNTAQQLKNLISGTTDHRLALLEHLKVRVCSVYDLHLDFICFSFIDRAVISLLFVSLLLTEQLSPFYLFLFYLLSSYIPFICFSFIDWTVISLTLLF